MAELSTLARPYAKAAFEHAAAAGSLDSWSEMLKTAGAVTADKTMQTVLRSPALTSQQQADALVGVLGDSLDTAGQNFLKILAENKRLALLPEISTLFEEHKAALEQSVDVEVSTAFELDDATINNLSAALKSKLARDVKVSTVVDKDLIGGVYVRAGDVVIDSSVRGRLAKLAEAMGA